MYFLTYHCKPNKESTDYNKVAGAFVNCYIESESIKQAEKISRLEILKNNWRILSLEDSYSIDSETISEKGRKYYDQALIDKIVFVYHTYDSNEESNVNFKNDFAVFTTKFVLEDKRTITYVSHELEDDAWQFFSNDEFDDYSSVAKVIGFNEILEIDPTLIELISLEPGCYAERANKNDFWKINKII